MTSPTRIHITGASGSGCTTLGRTLAERLGVPLLDTDDYFWHATVPLFQKKRDREERNAGLKRDMALHAQCVISGSVMMWDSELDDAFDLVVFLHVPDEVRMARLIARETERFGTPDAEFIAWAATYETADTTTRSLALHREWLAQRTCDILPITGNYTIEANVARILCHLGEPSSSSTPPCPTFSST
ncbi:shikimate kinase [Roseimicrobium gellanilyticum]|uniref:Shikimate kinase n=1 Tax=Roseimicrobium gellanilyticum TaxID=748857 RepID=A0A366HRU8_9BACT|nr:AAA family ATPase [Roseimicrobium gellanilyticum]RBP46405.1 shikimate kinase [Roseimicrobium gellanilyticum]